MRLTRKPRQADVDKYLISLVNIVFLLLVFFMIMGRIAPPDVFEVDPPESRVATPTEEGAVVILVGSDGRIAVDSAPVELSALSEVLSKRLQGKKDSETVTLKADGNTKVDSLDAVLDVVRALGVNRLTLLTERIR